MSWREHIGRNISQDGAFSAASSLHDSIDAEAAAMFELGEGALHPCWQPVTLPSGLHIFENRYTGTSQCRPRHMSMTKVTAIPTVGLCK